MTKVRIYRPAKSAMQSGRASQRKWILEFEPTDRKTPDPLMGWNGSSDTRSQVRMKFDSREEAVAFAERHGYGYALLAETASSTLKPKSYADNFRFDKIA